LYKLGAPLIGRKGVYSLVKFEFIQQDSTTLLVFEHTGIPEGQKQHPETGWNENYWNFEKISKVIKNREKSLMSIAILMFYLNDICSII
jgi:hypothetical protein